MFECYLIETKDYVLLLVIILLLQTLSLQPQMNYGILSV